MHGHHARGGERQVRDRESGVRRLRFARGFVPDYAWLITKGAPYHAAWEQYETDRDLPAMIAAVARIYATDPTTRIWRP